MARATTAEPRRRRRRPEEAEREILEAAEALFRELPSHEVSVSAVMERTTLSRKSFYVYFRDRHQLIARLVAPLREEIDARAAEAVAALDNPRDLARAIILTVATVYVEHGALLRALRVPVRDLRAGGHTLTVAAVDAAGNRGRRGFGFRRCR